MNRFNGPWWLKQRGFEMNTAQPIQSTSVPKFSSKNGLSYFVCCAENLSGIAALAAMGSLPVIELFLRSTFGVGIPGNAAYVSNLTLWVGFVGAIIAARENSHLSLRTGFDTSQNWLRLNVDLLVQFITAAVTAGLFWASLSFVLGELDSPLFIDEWLPEWAVEIILPVAFGAVLARFISRSSSKLERGAALSGTLVTILLGFLPAESWSLLALPCIGGIILAGLSGAPIFVLLGGLALILFASESIPVASVAVDIYRIAGSPVIATIPLFTLTGYILSHGRTTERLVRLFEAWLGWLPGGLAIASILVCAFFSTFTGASGVTILALGGILLPI